MDELPKISQEGISKTKFWKFLEGVPGGILKRITERIIGGISVKFLQEIPVYISERILRGIHEAKFKELELEKYLKQSLYECPKES